MHIQRKRIIYEKTENNTDIDSESHRVKTVTINEQASRPIFLLLCSRKHQKWSPQLRRRVTSPAVKWLNGNDALTPGDDRARINNVPSPRSTPYDASFN